MADTKKITFACALVALAACGGGGGGDDTQGEIVVLSIGGGRIIASPPGGPRALDCGPVCRASFDFGSTVTLEAMPEDGASFLGWEGACTGTGACVVSVEDYAEVRAMFGPPATTWSFGVDGRAGGQAAVAIGDGALIGGSAGLNSPTTFEHLFVQRIGEPASSNWTLASNAGGLVRDLAIAQAGFAIAVGGYDGALQVEDNQVADAQDGHAGFVLQIDPVAGTSTSLVNVDGMGSSDVVSVTSLADADFAVTGVFGDSLDFGQSPLVSAGGEDVFVAVNASDTWTSAAFGSPGEDQAISVNADAMGRIWVLVHFADPTVVGGITSGPGFAVLVLDPLLNPLNVLNFGGDLPPVSAGAIERMGDDTVVALSFAGTLNANAQAYTARGDSDWLVAVFHSDGQAAWVRQYGGVGTDLVSSVSTRGPAIYLVGSFEGQLDYGTRVLYSQANAVDPSATIVDDGIVMAADGSNGDPLWARRFGGWDADSLSASASLSSGLLVLGTFGGGPYALGTSTPSNLTSTPAAIALVVTE